MPRQDSEPVRLPLSPREMGGLPKRNDQLRAPLNAWSVEASSAGEYQHAYRSDRRAERARRSLR